MIPIDMDAVLLYENPSHDGNWYPLPSESEYSMDPSKLVAFPNGTQR